MATCSHIVLWKLFRGWFVELGNGGPCAISLGFSWWKNLVLQKMCTQTMWLSIHSLYFAEKAMLILGSRHKWSAKDKKDCSFVLLCNYKILLLNIKVPNNSYSEIISQELHGQGVNGALCRVLAGLPEVWKARFWTCRPRSHPSWTTIWQTK